MFDETVAVAGETGEYAAVARRKGDVWYVSAMTNWTERTVNVPLSFLADGEWTAEIFADGVNAQRNAMDYKRSQMKVTNAATLQAVMASGGGYAAIIKKK